MIRDLNFNSKADLVVAAVLLYLAEERELSMEDYLEIEMDAVVEDDNGNSLDHAMAFLLDEDLVLQDEGVIYPTLRGLSVADQVEACMDGQTIMLANDNKEI
jgi:hypothetical protein